MKRILTVAVVLALVVVSASVAKAQGFVRGSLGGGYTSSKVEKGDSSLTLSGINGVVSIMGGFFVNENLAIHLSAYGSSIVNPDLEICSSGTCITLESDDVTWNSFLVGGGLTYYIGQEIYFGGSLGLSKVWLKNEEDDEEYEIDLGFGMELFGGYDFMLSESFGLGAMVRLAYLYNNDSDLDEPWNTLDLSLLVSASLRL